MATPIGRNNPYVIGRPIYEKKLFFGREKLFNFVEDNLKQSVKVILLHGQRRIGKSSVLRQIPHFVCLSDFVFVSFDLQDLACEPLGCLLHNLAGAISDRLNYPQIQAALSSCEEMKNDPKLFEAIFLPQVYQALEGKNLVLLLDEFDVLSNYSGDAAIEHFFPYLQSLISRLEKLFIIPVVGRRLDDMPLLLSLFKGAPHKKIGLLDEQSAKELIVKPAVGMLEYDLGAIQAILEHSAGHPYFTQALCYALFTQARDEQRSDVTRADVESIVDKAIEISEAGLAWFRDGLSIPEKVVFSAVAESQSIDTVKPNFIVGEPLTLLKEYGVAPTEPLRQAGYRLVEWDFLCEVGTDVLPLTKVPTYKVTIELVRRWLVKRHSLRQEIWELENLDAEADEIYEIADKWRKRGNILNALNLYEQVLAVNPNHFNALFALAEGYSNAKNFGKAVELYTRAYQVNPIRTQEGFVQSLLNYGNELEGRRQLELAKEQFQRVLLLEPNNGAALSRLEEIEEVYRNKLDIQQFFYACNPSHTLDINEIRERQYYIDFSSVRGGDIIEALSRTIILSPDDPTCQLFTGHIGCGKSTELLRLKAELEERGFHVVYFESSEDMDMVDLDVSDILLGIARHVSESLEAVQIKLRPRYFANLFIRITQFLQIAIELSEEALSLTIAKIMARTKANPQLRRLLRDNLEPRTENILHSINTELLESANNELKARGKKGLVVIVDNLDRVAIRPLPSGRSQPEYLFIDRGEQLRKLHCHMVYVIPQKLIFSHESEHLMGGGVAPKVLPMVPVQLPSGSHCQEGIELLRQMVLARAFPEIDPQQRLDLVSEVFDSSETLDRLCRISGGHVRKLLALLQDCLLEEDPPISRECLESVIMKSRDHLTRTVRYNEWDLLRQVIQQQTKVGEEEYQLLLRSMLILEYQYQGKRWFAINPMLAETEGFMP